VLGTLLAGGENRRYGSHKAFAALGKGRIADRALEALEGATGRAVIVANDVERYRIFGRPVRPDLEPGHGALGGIHTAVRWASEEGFDAALVIACDMPFVTRSLLRALVERAGRGAATLPASTGPRGFEPLCAAYGVECDGPIAAALARGEHAVISFFPAVEVRLLAPAEVAAHGDPATLFLNINRPQERERAERLLEREVTG